MTRSAIDRCGDVLLAIAHARTADSKLRAAEGTGDIEGVEVAFDAILHYLFVIGEAVKGLPQELLDATSEIDWRQVARMRDVIGHHYHRIRPAVIHRTVGEDLGALEAAVQHLLDRLGQAQP